MSINYTELAYEYAMKKQIWFYRGSFWDYDGTHYAYTSREEMQARLGNFIADKTGDAIITQVNNLFARVQAVRRMPEYMKCPRWLKSERAADHWISCKSGLVDIESGIEIPHNDDLFITHCLPFTYNKFAKCSLWMQFLWQALKDEAQIRLLQTWFGYCLTANTARQKWLLCIGPPGSGKGTIARILTALLGPVNVGSVSLQSISSDFGLSNLLGKSVCLVPEIEVGRDAKELVQTLKSITGEDVLTINRKYEQPVTASLPCRVMAFANALPKLPDASNALAKRMLLLIMPDGVRGTDKEDPKLGDKLLQELDGILNWAMAGWHKLRKDGGFIQPMRGKEEMEDFLNLSSPYKCFADEYLTVDHTAWTSTDNLYKVWNCFTNSHGHKTTSTEVFVSNLKSVLPGIMVRKRKTVTSGKRIWGYDGVDLTAEGRSIVGRDT